MLGKYSREQIAARLRELGEVWVEQSLEYLDDLEVQAQHPIPAGDVSAEEAAYHELVTGNIPYAASFAVDVLMRPDIDLSRFRPGPDAAPAIKGEDGFRDLLPAMVDVAVSGLRDAWDVRNLWSRHEPFTEFAEPYVSLRMDSALTYGVGASLYVWRIQRLKYADMVQQLGREPTLTEWALRSGLLTDRDVVRVPSQGGDSMVLVRNGDRRVRVALIRARELLWLASLDQQIGPPDEA